MDPVALRELEHGEDFGFSPPVVSVVHEHGHDVFIRTSEKKKRKSHNYILDFQVMTLNFHHCSHRNKGFFRDKTSRQKQQVCCNTQAGCCLMDCLSSFSCQTILTREILISISFPSVGTGMTVSTA